MKVLAVILGLVAVLTTALLGLEAAAVVLFGWPFFLARVVPRVQADGATVIVGSVAVALFTLGIHLCGRRRVRVWKFRWSAMAVLAAALLFGIGIAVIGIAHQVVWLSTADRPLTGRGFKRAGSSTNNLRQLGVGIQSYHDANRVLPSGGTFSPEGQGKHGWVTPILPYFGYYARGVNMDRPWNDPSNRLYFKCVLPDLINAEFRTAPFEDVEGFGLSHYAANQHVMGSNTAVKLTDLRGGGSEIALVGEVNDGFKPWGHPRNWRDPAFGTGGGETGFGNSSGTGALFVMADGSVRFLSRAADPAVLDALAGSKR